MSGASGVRGGFDSHAFPPCLALATLLLGALLQAGAARAQVRPDSLAARAPAPADTLAAPAPPGVQVVGGAATAARADTTRRLAWHDQPRFVMARSLVFPAWGQMYNHAWFKAVLVAVGEGVLIGNIVHDQRDLNRLLDDLARARADTDVVREAEVVNEYNSRLDRRLAREWMLGGVIAYALVDAYVDAHFRGFDVEFQNDPALPAGTSPGAPKGAGRELGLRVSLRRRF